MNQVAKHDHKGCNNAAHCQRSGRGKHRIFQPSQAVLVQAAFSKEPYIHNPRSQLVLRCVRLEAKTADQHVWASTTGGASSSSKPFWEHRHPAGPSSRPGLFSKTLNIMVSRYGWFPPLDSSVASMTSSRASLWEAAVVRVVCLHPGVLRAAS